MKPGGRIPDLLLGLLDSETRPKSIEHLAAEIGADAIFLLLIDPETGNLLPAPGFPQELPRAFQWKAFAASVAAADGRMLPSRLPYPEADAWNSVCGIGRSDGSAWFCLGREPSPEKLAELHGWLPWLAKTFRAEADLRSAKAKEDLALHQVKAAEEQSRREIEERKKIADALLACKERLRQSQKMEAMGRLSGGIAHDFNNLLTSINGYSALALDMVDETSPLQSYLREIKDSGDRAAALTRQLLAYSHKQILRPRVLNVNAIVIDMHRMLKRLIGADIELLTRLDPGLGMIRMDPGQLEQILLNLSLSARDAMPHGGRLIFETENVFLDEEFARAQLEIDPGPCAALSVSDTGAGMAPEIKARIFEPLFTTNEAGGNSGLGLSSAYGVVKQCGGGIIVHSQPGEGTTFRIYFPLLGETGGEGHAPALGFADYSKAGETILLAEDEEAVRKFIRHSLVKLGYNVLEARDGLEAVHIHETFKKTIHLLLTDVVMPKMNGVKLSEALSATRPETKVIFMSGYAESSMLQHGGLEAATHFLPKPFSPAHLAHKVRESLMAEPKK